MNNQNQFMNVATVRCGAQHEITEVQLDGNGQINAYVGKIKTEHGDTDMLWMANGKAAMDGIAYDLVQKVPVKIEEPKEEKK